MKTVLMLLIAAVLAAPSATAVASKKERVLWIETREQGRAKASIAVSVSLAKSLLNESDDSPIDRDLITREMIDDVLSGREESVETTDAETGQSARLWLGFLEVESRTGDDSGDLVVEVFKKGKRSFTLRLPYAREPEASADDDPDISRMTFGWNTLMPFMAETKGVVYLKSLDEDTEFWMYVD